MASQTQAQFEQSIINGVSGIYVIKRDGGVLYVGQSIDIGVRWRHHIARLVNGDHANRYLQRIADKNGIGCLLFSIVEVVEDRGLLNSREAYWIERLQPKCNMTIPVDDGYIFTDERKRKISASLMGHRISDETRAKISQAHKGKKLSEDARKRLKEGSRRAWSNPEYRHAMSVKRRRYERPSRERLFADLIEHGGYCALCRVYGVSKNGLRQWCIDYDLPYKAADLEGMSV